MCLCNMILSDVLQIKNKHLYSAVRFCVESLKYIIVEQPPLSPEQMLYLLKNRTARQQTKYSSILKL